MRFVVYYTREPHARQLAFADVAQPKTHDERAALARRTCDDLQLAVDVWIDDLQDTSRATFGDLPNPALVIDAKGVIRAKLPWFDPDAVAAVLAEIAGERPQPAPPRAEEGFLAAVAAADGGTPAIASASADRRARHHRRAMLAWLAEHRPEHEDRPQWLEELLRDAPPWQRAFVERQRSGAGTATGASRDGRR